MKFITIILFFIFLPCFIYGLVDLGTGKVDEWYPLKLFCVGYTLYTIIDTIPLLGEKPISTFRYVNGHSAI
jgi:hypothetical protein